MARRQQPISARRASRWLRPGSLSWLTETSLILLVTPVLVKRLRALTMFVSLLLLVFVPANRICDHFIYEHTEIKHWYDIDLLHPPSSIFPLRKNKQMLVLSGLIQRVVGMQIPLNLVNQITHPSTLMYHKDKGFSSTIHELLIASWHRPGTWTRDQEYIQYS